MVVEVGWCVVVEGVVVEDAMWEEWGVGVWDWDAEGEGEVASIGWASVYGEEDQWGGVGNAGCCAAGTVSSLESLTVVIREGDWVEEVVEFVDAYCVYVW